MEGFVGSSVVGVEYPPGFQLGDGAFDDVAELVDAGVELFAVVGEVVAGGFADGGDHPGADIGFVGDEGLGWQGLEQATGSQGGQVVGGAGAGWGDPGQVSGQGAGDLDGDPGGVVFAGVQLRAGSPGPARQQCSLR